MDDTFLSFRYPSPNTSAAHLLSEKQARTTGTGCSHHDKHTGRYSTIPKEYVNSEFSFPLFAAFLPFGCDQ